MSESDPSNILWQVAKIIQYYHAEDVTLSRRPYDANTTRWDQG